MTNAARRRMVDTKKVYMFEDLFLGNRKDTPIKTLRRLAEKVWRENTERRDRCPRVVAGRGTPFHGRLASYCEGRSKISLARNQRNRATLLHEMTHALGPETHGVKFQKLYAYLIWKYL